MSGTAFMKLSRARHGGCVDPWRLIQQHPLLAFFILAFGFTWGIDSSRVLDPRVQLAGAATP
jgi:hypothetical protein